MPIKWTRPKTQAKAEEPKGDKPQAEEPKPDKPKGKAKGKKEAK